MQQNLLTNYNDFWTSNSDSSDSQDDASHTSDSRSDTVIEPGRESMEDIASRWLEDEDVTFNKEFSSQPRMIPEPTITPPKPNMIRKRWAVYDDSPIDNFSEVMTDMAMTFPFELDPFQKRAIRHVHNHEHTLVAAHTSAGKTVVADYAIAAAARNNRRAIYTSPIKALSNQKFREFKSKFDKVGIITGDVTLNADAQCLIMTTEILRSMIYRGDALLHQLDVVIFDEIHYINDAERGVVWEEIIIMLPRNVCLVMLSATVPNYLELADWVGRTKEREVFAVSTFKRPTPLKHFLWANDKEFLLMDQSKFNVSAFNSLYKHKRELQKESTQKKILGSNAKQTSARLKDKHHGNQKFQQNNYGAKTKNGGNSKFKSDTQRLQSLIRHLENTDKLPVVVFCFSKKKCESFPVSMPKLDFLHKSEERSQVHTFLKENFSNLSLDDQKLPQVLQVSSLLQRGIGVHHGGLLPIVKEAVELMFSKGIVRVLFATETFAMGVNMPARSVIFSNIEKHDGVRSRMLLPSEYIQMAGRAGRRGLDSFGTVFILCSDDEPPDHKDISQMMHQRSGQLESRFRITFAMLLQLAGKWTLKMEDMLSKSFQEYKRACRLPTLKRDKGRLQTIINKLPTLNCYLATAEEIENYFELQERVNILSSQLNPLLWAHQYTILSKETGSDSTEKDSPFCAGRVITVHSVSSLVTTNPGVIISVDILNSEPMFTLLMITTRPVPQTSTEMELSGVKINTKKIQLVDVPIQVQMITFGSIDDTFPYQQCGKSSPSFYYYFKCVPLSCISLVTSAMVRSHVLPTLKECDNDTVDDVSLCLLAKELRRVLEESAGEYIPPQFAKSSKMFQVDFVDNLLQQKQAVLKLNQNMCHGCCAKEEHLSILALRRLCQKKMSDIENLLSVKSLNLYDEMKLKYKILQERDYIDQSGCPTLKGRIAMALTTSDELTLTEALLNNVFHDKTPSEVAALLSCFVFMEKTQNTSVSPTQAFMSGKEQIEAIHIDLQGVLQRHGVFVAHEDWWRLCNFGLSLVAFKWANGESFLKIMECCDIQEGTIVKTVLRLDELLRKLRTVVRTLMSDKSLEDLMEKTSNIIRRDIIFTLSLYLK